MSQNITLVYYYVPQDLDDPENPNAYGVNQAKENVTLRDIKKSFPLEGKYIFRFKFKFQNQNVWMDLNSDDQKIPLYNNRIFLKVTRLDFKGDLNTHQTYTTENSNKGQSQSVKNLSQSQNESPNQIEKQQSQYFTQFQQPKKQDDLMDF